MTERMRLILDALAAEADRDPPLSGPMTCNQIGWALGFDHGMEGDRSSRRGKRMGAANRVNFAVSRLCELGLVRYTSQRPGGLSGGAYEITDAGREAIA